MINKEWKFDTVAVHGSEGIDSLTGAISPPIYQSSTFAFKNADHGESLFKGDVSGYIYSRLSNPTQICLEREIAYLEGGESAVAFASGMAATSSLLTTLCSPGDNFVSSNAIYGGTHGLNIGFLNRMNIDAREVSALDLMQFEKAIDDKTKLLFIETPANPNLDIIHIKGCAKLAEEHGIYLVVDNTFATPLLQRPLELGAHFVIHSATKYIGGHGDTVAGLLIGPKEITVQIRKTMTDTGGCISPFNAWLLLRGLKTLAVRMRKHCENAMHVAQYLSFHPKIKKVYYPGLSFHPGHELAKTQMEVGFGGVIAFEINGNREDGKRVMNGVELCTLAVSLGDCDSLICHPASTTHSAYSVEEMEEAGISEALIRLSVGIEDSRDICADLGQALKNIS